MSASPESFRGLLDEAKKCYDNAVRLTRERDDDGFIRLVRSDDIDSAVEDLSRTEGKLRTKLRDLKKDSKQRAAYEDQLEKIVSLLSDLREKQRRRNCRK